MGADQIVRGPFQGPTRPAPSPKVAGPLDRSERPDAKPEHSASTPRRPLADAVGFGMVPALPLVVGVLVTINAGWLEDITDGCRRIRIDEPPGVGTAVVNPQTCRGREKGQGRGHEAGLDHHKVKPVGAGALMIPLACLSLSTQRGVE